MHYFTIHRKVTSHYLLYWMKSSIIIITIIIIIIIIIISYLHYFTIHRKVTSQFIYCTQPNLNHIWCLASDHFWEGLQFRQNLNIDKGNGKKKMNAHDLSETQLKTAILTQKHMQYKCPFFVSHHLLPFTSSHTWQDFLLPMTCIDYTITAAQSLVRKGRQC